VLAYFHQLNCRYHSQTQRLTVPLPATSHHFIIAAPTALSVHFQSMSDQAQKLIEFKKMKSAFMTKARNAKATDGVIDGGQDMELELVSTMLIYFHLLLI
jgi:hypothetical protein